MDYLHNPRAATRAATREQTALENIVRDESSSSRPWMKKIYEVEMDGHRWHVASNGASVLLVKVRRTTRASKADAPPELRRVVEFVGANARPGALRGTMMDGFDVWRTVQTSLGANILPVDLWNGEVVPYSAEQAANISDLFEGEPEIVLATSGNRTSPLLIHPTSGDWFYLLMPLARGKVHRSVPRIYIR